MTKDQTIGKIGETIIKKLLSRYGVDCIFMTGKIAEAETTVSFLDKNNNRVAYSYKQKKRTHPFDLVIDGKNFEIKTSRIGKDGKFCCSFKHNDIEAVDYLIVVILGNDNKPLNFYLFERSYFKDRKGLHFYNDKFEHKSGKQLITDLLTALGR